MTGEKTKAPPHSWLKDSLGVMFISDRSTPAKPRYVELASPRSTGTCIIIHGGLIAAEC